MKNIIVTALLASVILPSVASAEWIHHCRDGSGKFSSCSGSFSSGPEQQPDGYYSDPSYYRPIKLHKDAPFKCNVFTGSVRIDGKPVDKLHAGLSGYNFSINVSLFDNNATVANDSFYVKTEREDANLHGAKPILKHDKWTDNLGVLNGLNQGETISIPGEYKGFELSIRKDSSERFTFHIDYLELDSQTKHDVIINDANISCSYSN